MAIRLCDALVNAQSNHCVCVLCTRPKPIELKACADRVMRSGIPSPIASLLELGDERNMISRELSQSRRNSMLPVVGELGGRIMVCDSLWTRIKLMKVAC
jgi:hypothetical protein